MHLNIIKESIYPPFDTTSNLYEVGKSVYQRPWPMVLLSDAFFDRQFAGIWSLVLLDICNRINYNYTIDTFILCYSIVSVCQLEEVHLEYFSEIWVMPLKLQFAVSWASLMFINEFLLV